MIKFFVETLLFVFIIAQIVGLSSYTGESDHAPAPALQIAATQLKAKYVNPYNAPPAQHLSDPYAIAEQLSNTGILQKLAEREAQRIIQTGNIDGLMAEINKNHVQLRLLGYNF